MALKEDIVIMPCESNTLDIKHAEMVAEKFGIKTERVELKPILDSILRILPEGNKISVANLKPRLRMIILYYFANNKKYLVAGTGNKSEIMVGYFTKYGDGGVDILPIGGLLKTQIRELARELEIPEDIILKSPSAGLWEGQTDESEMGITYENLDNVITNMDRNQVSRIEPSILKKITSMIKKSEHKRVAPKVFMPR
jgi:NAD+ synthase